MHVVRITHKTLVLSCTQGVSHFSLVILILYHPACNGGTAQEKLFAHSLINYFEAEVENLLKASK